MTRFLTWLRDHIAKAIRWLTHLTSEDNAGVIPSSTRTIGLILAGSAASMTAVLDFYVVYQTLHDRPMDATMITAAAGVITALLGGSAWAIYRRGTAE